MLFLRSAYGLSALHFFILLASCSVSKTSYKQIKRRFTTILASQQADFYHERLLQEQIDLLGTMRSGNISIEVAGLGFFDTATNIRFR